MVQGWLGSSSHGLHIVDLHRTRFPVRHFPGEQRYAVVWDDLEIHPADGSKKLSNANPAKRVILLLRQLLLLIGGMRRTRKRRAEPRQLLPVASAIGSQMLAPFCMMPR